MTGLIVIYVVSGVLELVGIGVTAGAVLRFIEAPGVGDEGLFTVQGPTRLRTRVGIGLLIAGVLCGAAGNIISAT